MSTAFETLRKLVPKAEQEEHCGLCHQALAPRHEHLIDPGTRRLVCSCQACAILFDHPAAQYKRVGKRVRLAPECEISDAEWDGLMIPIGIAFFVRHSADHGEGTRMAAYYPSPAGPVESLLTLESPGVFDGLQADTEALLVNRAAHESYVLPIDECYRLVGLIRGHWKGLSGGEEVWREIHKFFVELEGRACA